MGDLVFPCFFFGFICLGILITYLDYRGREKQKSSWRTLAVANRLTFAPGNFFDRGAYVFGTYRGHYLKLETFPKSQGKHNQTYTRLTMSVNNGSGDHFLPTSQDILNEQITVKEVVGLFTAINLPYPLKGRVKAGANGQTVYYEQSGLENDIKYLQALFDLLSDLADAYTAVITLGGEVVPALHEIATDNNHVLREIASHLLYCIGRETTARLRDQADHLFCPHCLVYCHAHKVRLDWWRSVTYYGCRVCGQSRRFLEGRVVAVLNSQMAGERTEQGGVWRVNWLARRALFDFEEVVIGQATDEDVERFAVQVGNDTDPRRQPRYKQMLCVVSPHCRLSENSWRILRRTFGQVPALDRPN